MTHLDHITVTTHTLDHGVAWVRDVLGVSPQTGGTHPRMGTHNCLLRLGESLFLEVIAPDPAAPKPARPRWFGLDALTPPSLPALSTWVVRSADIAQSAAAASEPLGPIEPMSRGALNWLITIPADGRVPLDGVAPALIEWHTPAHPAHGLPDQGLSLARLDIHHPDPTRVTRLLQSLALQAPVSVQACSAGTAPHLVAHIDTAQGRRVLDTAHTDRPLNSSHRR